MIPRLIAVVLQVVSASGGAAVAPCNAAPPPPFAAPEAPASRLRLRFVPMDGDEHDDVHGFSGALIADRVRIIRGVQFTVIYADADEVRGVQMGALFNFSDQTLLGTQLSIGANFGHVGRGIQAAVGLNVAGALTGGQIGGANYAATLVGSQLGIYNSALITSGAQIGFIDGAAELSGAQIGLVNIAEELRGLQFGLINISRHLDGESLALLTIAGDGIHEAALYASEAMLANLAIKLGGRHLYTLLAAGYGPGDADNPESITRDSRRYGAGIGLGFRAALGEGRVESVEVEAASMALHGGSRTTWLHGPWLHSVRGQVIIRALSHLGILAGVSLNASVSGSGQDADLGIGRLEQVSRSGSKTLRWFPGGVIGVQI